MALDHKITFYRGTAQAGVGTVVFTPPDPVAGPYFVLWTNFAPFTINLTPTGTFYEFENINTIQTGGLAFNQNNVLAAIGATPGQPPAPATLLINAFMLPATLTMHYDPAQNVNEWTLNGGSEPVQGVGGTMNFAGPYLQPA